MKVIDIHQHCYPNQDPDGSKILHSMDAHNIAHALIMGCHKEISDFVGDNEDTARIVALQPDRFSGGVCINPVSDRNASDTIKKYYDAGFKCVKMFPDYGFYPDDPACYPVYELIMELDMFALFHVGAAAKNIMTGTPPPVASFKFCMPGNFDTLGHVFPELKIVLAHFGGGVMLYNLAEVISVCGNHANIYLDLSCSLAGPALDIYLRTRDQYLIPLPPEKLIWGSDNINSGIRLRENLESVEKLTGGNPELIETIFSGNAEKLLKL